MTDAHQQFLYDLIGSVFKAGQNFPRDPNGRAADILFPAGQQLVALVEGMIQEEREACAKIAGWISKECTMPSEEEFSERDAAKLIRARSRTSPSQPEVPT